MNGGGGGLDKGKCGGVVWGSVGERCGRMYGVSVKGVGKCVGVWGKVWRVWGKVREVCWGVGGGEER